MCLYPKLIKNRKYVANKKNGGKIPEVKDDRVLYVPVGCGNCIECRKKKKREWQVRLQEELKENKGLFVTLTFSDEKLDELCREIKANESNAVATLAVRRFLERCRKETGKSIKHWLITELGHNNTERIHLHGILFTDKSKEWLEKKWMYGHIWVGEYCNEKTINYIVKYVTKIDEDHKNYKSIILTSKGIGSNYLKTYGATQNRYNEEKTNENYRLNNGGKTALPIYYRNKIYTEEEREKLWLNKLDKNIRWIDGVKVKADDEKMIFEVLKNAQAKNKRLGYGDDTKEWKKEPYSVKLKELNDKRRYRGLNKVK